MRTTPAFLAGGRQTVTSALSPVPKGTKGFTVFPRRRRVERAMGSIMSTRETPATTNVSRNTRNPLN
ncbi:hypothetical protein ACFRAO_08830 [Streptomyces sp. NPDC056656]|uniref:hypothetical protein n=1 Tax=Streptomyces sp. NPDC056656 TaxID=3345895 RepID=UPI003681EF48